MSSPMGLLIFDIRKWAVPGDCPIYIQESGQSQGTAHFLFKNEQSHGTAHFLYKKLGSPLGLPTFTRDCSLFPV